VSDDVTLNTRGLDKLLKALKGKQPVARVGVLGDKNARKESDSNATIGAKHEFGDDKMPIRSFLRMPITDMMQKYLDKSKAFDKDALKRVIASGSILEWLKKVAITAEAIVADAFDSGGFGKWKPSNMQFKKNHQTLVETQQLRNSVTSDVKE
jgi:hypothetical protein